MLLISFVTLLSAHASKLVEYHFGQNYGTEIYDFSSNLNEGKAQKDLRYTDRGIYFNQNKHSVKVRVFSLPDVMYTFNILEKT